MSLLFFLSSFFNTQDLDRIITQIVKPKVSVYMAIDGVAPRAKLNQQRSRRFRSAKDMAEAAKDNQTFSHNDDTQHTHNHQLFDSNCITPGTEFLNRVSNTIKYFIRKKIKEDPLWRNLKIIFSGPEIPGSYGTANYNYSSSSYHHFFSFHYHYPFFKKINK